MVGWPNSRGGGGGGSRPTNLDADADEEDVIMWHQAIWGPGHAPRIF